MPEVTPIPKKHLRPWQCPRADQACTRTKPCNSCRGRRSRRSGLTKQRSARKALAVPDARFHGQLGNEENWRDPHFRDEVKSGQQVKALATRYLAAEAQSQANKAQGDPRPFRFVAMPEGMSDGLVVVRLSVWASVITPALS